MSETKRRPWYGPRRLWKWQRWQCWLHPYALAAGATYYPQLGAAPAWLCVGVWPVFLYYHRKPVT